MIGAGVFVVFAPAAAAAGAGMPAGLAIAAGVACCNALSTARLAVRHPQSGGAYYYGRELLGPLWGYLAGWSFIVGKTASCAAMALTAGIYLWPGQAHAVAVAAVVALTALNYRGVQKSALASRVIVALTLAVLGGAVTVVATAAESGTQPLALGGGTPAGVLQAAGLLFFAFAGYARIATLAEEVRDPARTIPRAVVAALTISLAVYAVVAVALLAALGPQRLAGSAAPLVDAVRAAGAPGLEPVLRIGAAMAALGALLSLILGVSRTVLAMARDRHLPAALAAVHPRFGVPYRADLVVGAVVAVLAGLADVRAAIGFSSFAVLVYYAVANAAAWRLGRRAVPAAGLAGCLLLAAFLPVSTVVAGVVVLLIGVAGYLIGLAGYGAGRLR